MVTEPSRALVAAAGLFFFFTALVLAGEEGTGRRPWLCMNRWSSSSTKKRRWMVSSGVETWRGGEVERWSASVCVARVLRSNVSRQNHQRHRRRRKEKRKGKRKSRTKAIAPRHVGLHGAGAHRQTTSPQRLATEHSKYIISSRYPTSNASASLGQQLTHRRWTTLVLGGVGGLVIIQSSFALDHVPQETAPLKR